MPLQSYYLRIFNWGNLTVLMGLILWTSHTAALANEDPGLISYPAHAFLEDSDLTLDIVSLHQSWSIQLQEKSLLGSLSSVQSALYAIPEFFSGVIIGEPGSWARMARDSTTSRLSGHVFSDGTLYELQYREDTGMHTVTRQANSASTLPNVTEPNTDSNNITTSGRSIANGDLPLRKAIRVGIVVDSRYNEQYNGRGLAHALGVMNGVDGLYQNQLGLAVVVESFRVYDNPNADPLRALTGTANQLLSRYRNERLLDSELSEDLALVHLFTGLRDSQKVIGLGWINTVCSSSGYDLSLSTPFLFDTLLAAHEIAHNLGAIHDDDAQCLSDESITGTEVMWSELSGNTRPTFSSCSLIKLRQTINSGECVADNIDVSVALNAAPTVISDQRAIDITVFNHDTSRHADQINSLTTFPLGTVLSNSSAGCSIQGATLLCQHGSVGAQAQSNLSANAIFNGIDNPIITTELNFDLFIDTHHKDNRVAIQLDSSGTISNSSIAPDPAISPASSDSFFDQPADDQNPTTLVNGGSAGVRVGSASSLMLPVLSLFLLLAFRRQQHASVVTTH